MKINSAANNFQFQQLEVGNFVFGVFEPTNYFINFGHDLNIELPFVCSTIFR